MKFCQLLYKTKMVCVFTTRLVDYNLKHKVKIEDL